MKKASRIRASVIASAALFACYLLCGHVFLHLHGMGQWPIVLLVFGLIVIVISALANARNVMIGTIAGYLTGFALGMVLGHDYYMSVGLMPDGHELFIPRHNGWAIWTLAYLAFIALGVIGEVISRYRAT